MKDTADGLIIKKTVIPRYNIVNRMDQLGYYSNHGNTFANNEQTAGVGPDKKYKVEEAFNSILH